MTPLALLELCLSVIYANTASRLQALYESQWTPDCNYPRYLELISRKLK